MCLHHIPTYFSALICNLATVYILHKQIIKGYPLPFRAWTPWIDPPLPPSIFLSVANQEHSYYPQILDVNCCTILQPEAYRCHGSQCPVIDCFEGIEALSQSSSAEDAGKLYFLGFSDWINHGSVKRAWLKNFPILPKPRDEMKWS